MTAGVEPCNGECWHWYCRADVSHSSLFDWQSQPGIHAAVQGLANLTLHGHRLACLALHARSCRP